MKQFFKYVLATIVGFFAITVIGFFLFFIIIGALISSTEKQVSVQNNSMLVIETGRTVLDRAVNNPFEDFNIPGFEQVKTIGLDEISESLEKAVYDDRIKGVYLKLSSVGGGMASVEEIRNMLIKFKEASDKPIYAYGDNIDQKAYYLASVADKIVINPMGMLDFRGLGGEMMFYKNALDKIGVDIQVVRHGKFKAAVEPFLLDKMSDENREQTLVYMNSLWNGMLKGISETRNISVEALNALADDVQTFKKGEELVENGLVDATKYKDEVLNDLREITGITGTKGVPVISVSDYANVLVKGKTEKYSRNKIAVVYASGEIGASISLSDDVIIGEDISREIRKVRQDSSYKAIVFRVNSPGGSVFDAEEIWREVKLAAEEKTLVVSFGDYAASGGYYISCPADLIVSQPNTITGSIGVFGTIPDFGELLTDKIGITTDEIATNKNSNLLSVTRPMTEYERNLMQANVEQVYDTFISHVAEGRAMTKEKVDEIGQGRVWTGENAKELGLVDELGGLDLAIERAAEIAGLDEYRTVSLPELRDPIQELLQPGAGNVRAWFLKNELGDKFRYYEYFKKTSGMNGIYARMPYDIYIN
ncbi:MAG: signal peptide peptidase SppA [Prolixibacteraceae bacterium]|nr:signal peptide peptidase SppA [Prolixibacteraceae bacterium]